MTRATLTAALLLAVLTTACEQKPKNDLVSTPAVQPAQPALPANAAAAPINLDQVPVSEDFEEQAALEISAADVDSQLEKLDLEITE
jgi:hypothetical protein